MVWLVLRRNLLQYFHHLLFLLFLNQNFVQYSSMSHTNCFIDQFERSFFLLTHYHLLLHTITYSFNLKWCDWFWGGTCYIISTDYIVPGLSQRKLPMILHHVHTNCFMNLLVKSFSCWLITIYYIQLLTHSIWKGVIGVEEELVTLFLQSVVPTLSQPKLYTILLHVSH